MERLTEVRNGEAVIPLRNAVCGVNMPHWCINNESDTQSFLSGDAADRLAAYEDTGLTPSEILEMRDLCESLKGMYELNAFRDEHLQAHCENLESELARYKQSEREGRLVVLPCKVGEYWERDGKRYIVAEISVTNAGGVMVRHYEEGNGEMLSCNPQYFAKHYTRDSMGIPVDRHIEICEAEREGRLVVLPCKEGTPLYHIDFVPCETCTKRGDMPLSNYRDLYGDPYVLDCEEECPEMVREYPAKFQLAMMDLVGKDLFLTREEAEAALKERNE